jgi:competence protein ComEA
MIRWFLALALAFASQLAAAALDLNSATKDELIALSGIGPAKAQAIIDYRSQHGGFKSLDELKDVKGIGARQFEKLKPELTLAPVTAKAPSRTDGKVQALAAKTDGKPQK